jgi:hypothetical protein
MTNPCPLKTTCSELFAGVALVANKTRDAETITILLTDDI